MSTLTAGTPLRSVAIAMGALECFATDSELGVTEVARRLGVAKSTACRMLAALAAGGLLERAGAGRYRLGLKLFEYGQLAVDRLMLRELGLPRLAELREQVHETVQLGLPVGADVLYVDRLEQGAPGLMLHDELYRRVPGHSSSAGKVIAAFNPVVARAVSSRPFTRYTPFTIVDPARHLQVLRQVRAQGWASSREELVMGYSSVAAPIVVGDQAVAAISIVGPTANVLGLRKDLMVHSVRRAASRLSAELGQRS